MLKFSIESEDISFEVLVVTLVYDGGIGDVHEAGGDDETEEAVEPNGRRPRLGVSLGQVCLPPLDTVHPLDSLANLLQNLLAGLSGVSDDDVSEPNHGYWNRRKDIEIEDDKGEAKDSEEDSVNKEGEMTTYQIDVALEGLHVGELTNVDIEDVDHDCALKNVHQTEYQCPHGDARERDLILKAVLDPVGGGALLPWLGQDPQPDE